jgi:chitodextrinase
MHMDKQYSGIARRFAARLAGLTVVASASLWPAGPAAAQTTGLVAAYSFNEGTGTTVADASGNGTTGTVVNATWTTAGKYGGALSFNGSSSYVDLGNPSQLQLTGSMTWSAWVMATGNPPDDGQIIAKSDSGGGLAGWQFKSSPDTGVETFGVAVSANGKSNVQRYSKTVRALNTWYHVAGVYNAAARTLDIYVNGVLDDGVLKGTVPASQFNPNLNVTIGKRSGGFYFQGTIDEVRIYNVALTAAQIQADMNTPITGAPDTQVPTAPGNLTATAVSGSQINLNWSASTDNVGVTGYWVERQDPGSTSFVQIGTTTGTTYTNTGLAATSTYIYRVRATDAAGNLSSYSGTASATTPTPDTQPPTAPGNLAATAVSASQINLSWTAATDNVGVTGYLVERQAPGSTSFAQIGTTAGTTYNDLGLVAGTNYSYRVRATDAAGNLSPYSAVASATTAAASAGLVAAYSFNEGTGTSVTDVSGNGTTGTVVNATWTTSGEYGGALSFNGSSSYVDLGNPSQLRLTGSMTWSAWVMATGNPPDDGQIIAKSDSGGGLAGWQFKTTPDTGVETFGVAVSADGNSNVQRYSKTVRALNTWYYVAGVYNAAARTLDIYVNGVLDDGVLSGTVPASQFNPNLNVTIGKRSGGFYFQGTIDEVRIYNVALTSAQIQADMNTPISGAPDTQAPTAPGNLTATAVSGSEINLNWSASTDNVGVTGYWVEREDPGTTSFVQIGTTTGTTYTNTGLAANSAYSYRVRATDAAGNLSSYSGTASATTPTPDTQPPTAPGNLAATAVSASQINLSWSASTDNFGVTGYLVERGDSTGTIFTQVGTALGTGYSDVGLIPNSSYTYRVRATDASGNLSGYSPVASATTLAGNPGLVAAYSFNEGTGPTITDASGNGNIGTIAGATWTTAGKYGGALSFGGASYVDLGNGAAFQLTGSMTLSAWVYATGTPPDDGQIIAKSDSGSGLAGWQFKTTPDTGGETFGVMVSPDGNSAVQRYSKTVRALNTWYYVAGVYNASAKTLDIYVNGALDDGVLSGTVPGSQFNSTVNATIGRRSGGFYFQGTIDELRVYNVALTAAQIQADMSTPLHNAPTAPGNLTATLASLSQVNLSWTASTDSAGVAEYLVERCQGVGSTSFTQVGTATGTTYSDSGLTANTTYNYRVRALDSTGVVGPYSQAAQAYTGLSISPRVAALTFTRNQQFTASTGSVTWSVDGVVGGAAASGTISPTGLYVPPSSVGTHTVTATTLDQSQSASVTVYVTGYPGTFTHHNDNLRTGQNLNETVLTPLNVNSATFGRLFSYPLDGIAFSSPLYVANVSVPGQGFHNLVFVATEHDSVYAYDADGLVSTPIWHASFINPAAGITTVPASDTGEPLDIPNEVGITSTPVIDPATGTLYVVAATKEIVNGATSYVQRLHALDIANGAEKFGGPVVIAPVFPGTGAGSQSGLIHFDPLLQNQRSALMLANGVVYFGFGTHGNPPAYHGWVLGYNATTLQQVMVYNTTPNDRAGGVWQAGGGVAADSAGNLYFATGNGTFDANVGGSDYGDSVMKISSSGSVMDYFTPHEQQTLDTQDIDLGSGGVLLLPDQSGPNPHLLISAGKSGTLYLINRDNLGHYNQNADNQIVQVFPSIFPGGDLDIGNRINPVYFNGNVYFSVDADNIKMFQLSNGLLSSGPTSESVDVYLYPGAPLAISANGAKNGILWAVQRFGLDATGVGTLAPGVLRAYDAANLATVLYDSNQAGLRDMMDYAAKFSIPLVANGKVFVGSQNQLAAYGLLP